MPRGTPANSPAPLPVRVLAAIRRSTGSATTESLRAQFGDAVTATLYQLRVDGKIESAGTGRWKVKP